MSKNSKLLNDSSKDNNQRENPQSGKSGIENQLPPIAADSFSQLKTNSPIAPPGLTGKSKQLFDHFYKLTHGAINPVSTVRISRSQLMSGAGIRSLQTFYKCLNDLILRGLVKKSVIGGEQDGNIYQVFVLAEPDPAEPQSDPGDPIHPSPKSVDPVPKFVSEERVNELVNDLSKPFPT